MLSRSHPGKIRVAVCNRPTALEIQVSDDGRGLALAKLRERAAVRELSDELVAEQIFASGVTTAEAVNQVAGRGVGLASDCLQRYPRGLRRLEAQPLLRDARQAR